MSVTPETTAETLHLVPSNPEPGDHNHPEHDGQTHLTTPSLQYTQSNRGLYEWTARVECKKFELGCSYSVIIFLGHVPDDPTDWQVSPNYVGSHYAFVNSVAEGSEDSRKKADVVIEGFVHLNQAIIRRSGLHSLEPEAVVPYLTKYLHWRVLKVKKKKLL